MPVFLYVCPSCGARDRLLLTPAGGRAVQKCRKTAGCIATLKRTPRAPSMVMKEVIDNGAMSKAVERDVDGERLMHEQAQKDYRRPE